MIKIIISRNRRCTTSKCTLVLVALKYFVAVHVLVWVAVHVLVWVIPSIASIVPGTRRVTVMFIFIDCTIILVVVATL